MMRNVGALTLRELGATFLSPVAYVVGAVFLVAAGYLFTSQTLVQGNEATLRPMLESMAWLLAFATPLLTMRVLSEEFATGTIETLMTAPVTDFEVVFSKFLGVLTFYVALLLATLLHAVLLFVFGSGGVGAGEYTKIVMYGYLGMVLLGALYVSIGVFASALTRHQLVAAIIGIGVLSLLTLVVDRFAAWKGGAVRQVLGYVNVLRHFEDFSKGIFDTGSLMFFITGTVFFLFLSIKMLESRRWR